MPSAVAAAKRFIEEHKLADCRILSKNKGERKLALVHTLLLELIKEIEDARLGSPKSQA